MNLWFRLLLTLWTSRFRPPVRALEVGETAFRCWFSDLDLLAHMNNGKYLSIMDVARVDLIVRSGLGAHLRRNGYFPVVEAQTIRFRRSLRLFDRFKIRTKVVGWDEKSFFVTQEFVRSDEVVAEAKVKVRFLKKPRGSVAPSEVMKLLNENGPSPKLDPSISMWVQSLDRGG